MHLLKEKSMRLQESRFLALGEGARLACRILPGSAFKLYVYLCFLADRETGRVEVRYQDLARELGRCERSLGSDFELLRTNRVCTVDSAVNQHKLVLIEIADKFWAYEKNQNHTQELAQRAGTVIGYEVNEAKAALSEEQRRALSALLDFGIAPKEAESVAKSHDANAIIDDIEYVIYLASIKGNSIRSPQSLLIHRIRNEVPVPHDFVTSRERERKASERQRLEEQSHREELLRMEYQDWCRAQGQRELQKRLSLDQLEEEISKWASQAKRNDPRFANTPTRALREIAHRSLVKEACSAMDLPTFHAWCRSNGQQSER